MKNNLKRINNFKGNNYIRNTLMTNGYLLIM